VTSKDSHFSLPISNASSKELDAQIHLFKYFNYLPLAMTAHIKYLNWDSENIATFSPKIIKKIIRNVINFKGLIMTDDLMMKANIFDISKAVSYSNKANIDIILDCSSDWNRYIKIINNFKITKRFQNLAKIRSKKVKKRNLYIKSININNYHHLYNELIKLYGI